MALNSVVPKLMFVTKLGILLAVLCNYQANLSDDDIFPAAKRATCIGQCQLVARAITVLASEVAELPKPKPMAWFCGIVGLAFCISLTFTTRPKPEAIS